MNFAPNVRSDRRCRILAITWITAVPNSHYSHTDNSCDADAPLPRGFCHTWRVRCSSLFFCPAHHDQCRFSTHENFQISGLKFAETKQIRATPIPLNLMETCVCAVLQQHSTRQMSDHGLSTDMDEDVYEKSNGSTLEEDVERGV